MDLKNQAVEDDDNMLNRIRSKADENFCFGWAQRTIEEQIVGEVRCNKRRGIQMMEWLLKLGDKVMLRQYEDTKIFLHFSRFELLDIARKTCFQDAPHQCPELKHENNI
mmetsp:Transcript_21949/g.32896  ORF Transcript_21949/g.32896 Transcript_21949/m.32896 type:complete len:109 (+) Transcript_21949:274-600(+)